MVLADNYSIVNYFYMQQEQKNIKIDELINYAVIFLAYNE